MGDARRFGRNFASLALAQVVSQLLTLVASIALARDLSVTAYGIFVFGFAFPSWFLVLLSLGLDEVIATDVAADRSRASRYLTIVALLRIALAGPVLAALWVATDFAIADDFARTIILLLGASSIVSTIAATFLSLFRAFERSENQALVTIAERAVTVGAALLLLFLGYGLLEVAFAFLGGSFVALGLALAITKRKFAWFTRDIDAGKARQIVRRAIPFGLHNLVGTLTYSSGLVLLTVLRDPSATGLFNASFTLLIVLFSFLSIVNSTLLPMMSRVNRGSREQLAGMLHRVQRLSLIAGIPLSIGGWFYAEEIVTLFYGASFNASAESFRILIVGFSVVTLVMGNAPALAATGHMKLILYIGCASSVSTIALGLLLIPGLGHVGAAYALLAAHIIASVLGTIAVHRYIAPVEQSATVFKSALAGFVMLLVLLAVPGLTFGTGVILGGFVYFLSLAVLQGISKEDGVVVWEGIRGALFP